MLQGTFRKDRTTNEPQPEAAIPTDNHSAETGRPIYEEKNNITEITSAVARLEAAAREAEKLKLLALTDAEVATRLHKLAETLPAQVQQEVLILDDLRGYDVEIRGRSEMVRQSQPWKDIKRAIHESRGLGSFGERRR